MYIYIFVILHLGASRFIIIISRVEEIGDGRFDEYVFGWSHSLFKFYFSLELSSIFLPLLYVFYIFTLYFQIIH